MELALVLLFWAPSALFLSALSTCILGLAAVPALRRTAERFPELHRGTDLGNIGPGYVLAALVMAAGAGAAWAHLFDTF